MLTVARAKGIRIDTEDAVISATADLRSLVVLSANLRRFAPTGIACLDPFDALPPEAG